MHLSTRAAGAAAALLLGVQGAFAKLDKVHVQPDLGSAAVEAQQNVELNAKLPQHLVSWEDWNNDYIPKAFDMVWWPNEGFTYDVHDIETRNVKYSDCPHNSAISRHKDADQSWEEIMEIIGKVPVGFRQYTANVMIMPAGSLGVCAYAGGSSIVFVGRSCHNVHVWTHEGTHVLDITAMSPVVTGAGYPSGTRYSETSLWAGAYSLDPNVITPYAETNQIENFAEVGSWVVTDIISGTQMSAYTPNRWQVINQISEAEWRLRNIIWPWDFPAGGICTGKVFTTEAIHKDSLKVATKAMAESRIADGQNLDFLKTAEGAEGVPEIKTPEGMDWTPVACPRHAH